MTGFAFLAGPTPGGRTDKRLEITGTYGAFVGSEVPRKGLQDRHLRYIF